MWMSTSWEMSSSWEKSYGRRDGGIIPGLWKRVPFAWTASHSLHNPDHVYPDDGLTRKEYLVGPRSAVLLRRLSRPPKSGIDRCSVPRRRHRSTIPGRNLNRSIA